MIKYNRTTFGTKVIPIAIDFYFEIHNLSYNSLAKYMNLDVLKQISAYWLSRMISEMKNSYNIGVEQSNELHRAYLV